MVQQLSVEYDGFDVTMETEKTQEIGADEPLEMTEYLEENGLGHCKDIYKDYLSPRYVIGKRGFLTLSLYWTLAGALVIILLFIGLVVAGLSCCPSTASDWKNDRNETIEVGRLQNNLKGLEENFNFCKNETLNLQTNMNGCQNQTSDLQNEITSKNAEIERQLIKIIELEDKHAELKNHTEYNLTMCHNSTLYETDQLERLKKYFGKKSWDAELFRAIDDRDEDGLKELISFGADVRGIIRQETVLHRAANCSDKTIGLRMIKLLIEKGADPFAKTGNDYTFLHKLVDDGSSLTPQQFNDISRFLISKNLSRIFNIQGNFFKGRNTPRYYFKYKFTTPFQLAVRNIDVESETLTFLFQNGVNFNLTNSEGESALKYAVEGNRNITLLSDLVNLGADWRQVNKIKNNLLHAAALYGNLEGMKYLVKLGLDVNAVDDHGNTALHYVALYGNRNSLAMVRFLIESGVNVKLRNGGGVGETALDRAGFRYDSVDKDKIIQLLRDKSN